MHSDDMAAVVCRSPTVRVCHLLGLLLTFPVMITAFQVLIELLAANCLLTICHTLFLILTDKYVH